MIIQRKYERKKEGKKKDVSELRTLSSDYMAVGGASERRNEGGNADAEGRSLELQSHGLRASAEERTGV